MKIEEDEIEALASLLSSPATSRFDNFSYLKSTHPPTITSTHLPSTTSKKNGDEGMQRREGRAGGRREGREGEKLKEGVVLSSRRDAFSWGG